MHSINYTAKALIWRINRKGRRLQGCPPKRGRTGADSERKDAPDKKHEDLAPAGAPLPARSEGPLCLLCRWRPELCLSID